MFDGCTADFDTTHFRIANLVSPTFTNKHTEVQRDKENELSQ